MDGLDTFRNSISDDFISNTKETCIKYDRSYEEEYKPNQSCNDAVERKQREADGDNDAPTDKQNYEVSKE
ncbi:hypothetical protein C450_17027 [Halococcus salifodinae DSM 8989]|uniref:Uncharacterized protein n=1 Tax=Halococcus salifodinae DSM 8989 TaxID=1227456 RepID=M0MUK8_9EURY|nr:hypothetical protein C450_17027 [Halococcus salifodinae DSM 8989]